jgi:hypothetical protein
MGDGSVDETFLKLWLGDRDLFQVEFAEILSA